MPGHGREQHAAGREDAVQRRERGAHVVDELQRLRDDRAVEACRPGCAARPSRSPTIVACGFPSVAMRMSTRSTLASEPRRVVGRRDLEHAAADVGRVRADEPLDVHAVDRRSALEAPVRVDRRDAPEVAELRRPASGASRRRLPQRTKPATGARGNESSPAGQGRDHRPSCDRSAKPRSSSSRRTPTTACSRSARRWRAGRARASASSC